MKWIFGLWCKVVGYHCVDKLQIFAEGPSDFDIVECTVCGFTDKACNYE